MYLTLAWKFNTSLLFGRHLAPDYKLYVYSTHYSGHRKNYIVFKSDRSRLVTEMKQ